MPLDGTVTTMIKAWFPRGGVPPRGERRDDMQNLYITNMTDSV